MDSPLPLTTDPGPCPRLVLPVPDLRRAPTPEEFEEAVARCAAFGHEGEPVLAMGLESVAAARAALLGHRGPVWCLFHSDGEGLTAEGTEALAGLIVAQGMGAAAFGLVGEDGEELAMQYRRLAPYAAIPLVWPAGTPLPEGLGEELAAQAGAALGDPDVLPCAGGAEARFISPDVDVGETLRPGPHLLEEILDSEESRPQGALKIAILEEDDLLAFTEAQYAIRDALCLWSDVPEFLERALRYYQGRAFWDGTGDLPAEFLAAMGRKYGLVCL